MVYCKILNIVPCAIQQDLIVTSHFIFTTYVAFCCFLSPFPCFAWFNQVTMHYLFSPLLSGECPWPLIVHEWLSSPFPTFIPYLHLLLALSLHSTALLHIKHTCPPSPFTQDDLRGRIFTFVPSCSSPHQPFFAKITQYF